MTEIVYTWYDGYCVYINQNFQKFQNFRFILVFLVISKIPKYQNSFDSFGFGFAKVLTIKNTYNFRKIVDCRKTGKVERPKIFDKRSALVYMSYAPLLYVYNLTLQTAPVICRGHVLRISCEYKKPQITKNNSICLFIPFLLYKR